MVFLFTFYSALFTFILLVFPKIIMYNSQNRAIDLDQAGSLLHSYSLSG